jgi:hypothetical protein
MKSNNASMQVESLTYYEGKVKGAQFKLESFCEGETLNQITLSSRLKRAPKSIVFTSMPKLAFQLKR